VHDRAGGHRGLTATAGTLIGEGFSLEPPGAAFHVSSDGVQLVQDAPSIYGVPYAVYLKYLDG